MHNTDTAHPTQVHHLIDKLINDIEKTRAEHIKLLESPVVKEQQKMLSSVFFSRTINSFINELASRVLQFMKNDNTIDCFETEFEELYASYFKTDMFQFIYDYVKSHLGAINSTKSCLHANYPQYISLMEHLIKLISAHPFLLKYVYQFIYLGESSSLLRSILVSYLSDNHHVLDIYSSMQKEFLPKMKAMAAPSVDNSHIGNFVSLIMTSAKPFQETYAEKIREYKQFSNYYFDSGLNKIIYDAIIFAGRFMVEEKFLPEKYREGLKLIGERVSALPSFERTDSLLEMSNFILDFAGILTDIKGTLSESQMNVIGSAYVVLSDIPNLLDVALCDIVGLPKTSSIHDVLHAYYLTASSDKREKIDHLISYFSNMIHEKLTKVLEENLAD